MNFRSAWPDATAVHAALAPASVVVAERRALYQLTAELFMPGPAKLEAEQLDNPLFRFRVGEALAGRRRFDPAVEDGLGGVTTELRSGPARLRVATGAGADGLLAEAMRIIHGQSGSPGRPPRPLTEADGEPFRRALAVVAAGLDKAREVSPLLADDLLPHASLLVILAPETSGGLISASSRFLPGLILIDAPSCPFDVAEALIHEGAHQKFFDLAITHDFLGVDSADGLRFRPSWSGASWPVEQVIAAFHAYACLAQFAEDVDRAGENDSLGANSLLPSARERETEIGRWLLGAEETLEIDARWLLRTLLREDASSLRPENALVPAPDGRYTLDPLVRVARMEVSGRVLAARPGTPPELHWLTGEAAELVGRLAHAPEGLSRAEIGADRAAILAALADSSLACRVPETPSSQRRVLSSSD